ncbi:MAG: hypothetical protein ACD_76C00055G0003 [uncultured bacterium]|nr:MAG: hypothetical protein ACD_76C00055G0003 [uncultured bacterium]HBD05648.1 hypothetical protein [Candidatus Uhrbacteria bacterium]
MPSESLADVKQRDWIRACLKLGLRVETNHGKGSHVLVKHPQNGSKYTIQNDLYKILNIKIKNKLIQWGFTEDQIFEALR